MNIIERLKTAVFESVTGTTTTPNTVDVTLDVLSPSSKFAELCHRFFVCYEKLQRSFKLHDSWLSAWDEKSIVASAVACARIVSKANVIDFDNFDCRVLCCSCFTLSWKYSEDDPFICNSLFSNHTMLTTVYSFLWYKLKQASVYERDALTLHRYIQCGERHILERFENQLFPTFVLNPLGSAEIVLERLIYSSTPHLVIARKLAGFANLCGNLADMPLHDIDYALVPLTCQLMLECTDQAVVCCLSAYVETSFAASGCTLCVKKLLDACIANMNRLPVPDASKSEDHEALRLLSCEVLTRSREYIMY